MRLYRIFGVAVALAAADCASAAEKQCASLPDAKIGIQLFSIVGYLAELPPTPPGAPPEPLPRSARIVPADRLASSFAELHRIGYRNIERYAGTLGASDDAYAGLVRDNRLHVAGSHDNLAMAEWEETLDRAKALGQAYVGSGGFGGPGLDSLDDVLATARNLDAMGRAARAKGLRLYVHNHRNEFSKKYAFAPRKGGPVRPVSAWEIVAASTDPRFVSFEVDVHWARLGIGLDRFDDLLALLRRYRNRIVMLHLKDTAADGTIADLGAGTTDWPAVYRAAGRDIAYYLWEYDRAPDPLRSAEIAYRYMRCGR